MMRHFDQPHEGGRGGRGGGGRVFGHGGLRLVLLQLIADKPRHGYELIKEIADRLGGSYSPSPGVIYPTLTLLEELGYTSMSASDGGGRKLYTITDDGQAFLAVNREATDAMLARMQETGASPGRPPQVVRAMENFKMALRMRLASPLSDEQAHAVAQLLDQTTQNLERI